MKSPSQLSRPPTPSRTSTIDRHTQEPFSPWRALERDRFEQLIAAPPEAHRPAKGDFC
jgi:hypothetical protein